MTTVIVIGAGYAGLMAANRGLLHGLEVTLVNEREVMVDRIRLHEMVAGRRPPDRATRDLATAFRGSQFVRGRAASVAEGEVILTDDRRLTADHVVLATGSSAGPGNWAWAERYRQKLAELAPGSRLVVAGAGLTGIELATEVAEARPDLVVVLADPHPLGADLSDAGRRHLHACLAKLGVQFHQTAAEQVSADLRIDCTGYRVDTLAGDSGLPVNRQGQVLVDPDLRVRGHRRLWACGDGAVVTGQPHLRMACATAEPMGQQCADNLLRVSRGEPTRPLSLGYAARCLSLGRRNGLIQYVRRDDSPTERVQTGRGAAWEKELICRFAVVAPIHLPRIYRELGGPRG